MTDRPDRASSLLEEIGAEVDFPPTPDMVAAVAERVERLPGIARRRGPTRTLVAVAAALIALLTVLGLSPGARRAVAEWLGVAGIRIDVAPERSVPESTPAEIASLELGERLGLAEAVRRAGFPVVVPDLAPFNRPDEVWFDEGRVHIVYLRRAGIPAAGDGAAALLTQFRASVVPGTMRKVLGGATNVSLEEVDGAPAYWIEGAPHPVTLVDPEGRVIEENSRLAGDVLLWERGGVTYRLESALSLQRALAVARSLH